MAINFPSSPTNGQTLVVGASTYTYSSATGVWDKRVTTGTAEPFNYFVNPSFQISQQNGNTAGAVAGYFVADQWNSSFAGTVVMTAQRVQVVTPFGSPNRIRITVTTADAALATTDHAQCYTRIEGTRVGPFMWQNINVATPIVIRFGFKGPAGTYSIVVLNGLFAYNYIANFTITAGQANLDTIQTFAVPKPPAGTWQSSSDQGPGMQFSVWFAGGPTYLGVAGWNNAQVYHTSANTNGIGVAGVVYELFDFGMYRDPNNTGVPPPWQYTDEGTAMQDCQRYWYKSMCANGGNASTAGGGRMGMGHPMQMRAAPAFALVGVPLAWSVDATSNITAIAASYGNAWYCEHSDTTPGTSHTLGRACIMIADTAKYVTQNARM